MRKVRLLAACERGVQLGTTSLMWGAILAAVICYAFREIMDYLPAPVVVTALAVIASGAFGIWAVVIIKAYTICSPLTEIAQKLDANLNSQNAIATAYEIIHSDSLSIFSAAAVETGLAYLRDSHGLQFFAPINRGIWRKNFLRLAVAVLLAAIMLLRLVVSKSGSTGLSLQARVNSIELDTRKSAALPHFTQPTASALPVRPPAPSNKRVATDRSLPQSALLPRQTSANSAGGVNKGPDSSSSAGSATAKSPSSTARQYSGNQVGNSSKQTKDNASSSPNFVAADGSAATDQEPTNASLLASAATGDSSSHASASTDSKISAADSSTTGSPPNSSADSSQPQPDDASSSSSGNRREGKSASSDQSKASNSGDGQQSGKGRGNGSNTSKKSRGVGSIMLGVPIPDVVPGKLLNGTSTTSLQQIPPRPDNIAGPSPRTTVMRGDAVENNVERYEIEPGDTGDLAADYLIRVHQADASSLESNPPAK